MPAACDAMPILPLSRAFSAISSPIPGLPSRFFSGDLAILQEHLTVLEAREPHLFLVLADLSPFVPAGTRKAESPFLPVDVRAMRMNMPGIPAVGDELLGAVDDVCISLFLPPSVLSDDGSEPASGSVRAKAPTCSPEARGTRKLLFCSSVPKFRIGSVVRLVTLRVTATEAQE